MRNAFLVIDVTWLFKLVSFLLFQIVTSHVLTLSAARICTRLPCPLGRALIVKCHYCRGSEDICWPTWFWGSVLSLQFFSGLWMTDSVERIAVFFSQWVVKYIVTHPCFCAFIIFKPLDLSLSGWNLWVWLQGKGYPDVATRRYAYWVQWLHYNLKDSCAIQT